MKKLLLICITILLLANPSNVSADVAPPYFPPGSNPQPGSENTQVRMVAETVLIDVQNEVKPSSPGIARVTADFTMHNTGNTDENLAVRFPISTSDGRGQYPEITNIVIKINGKQVPFRRAMYPGTGYMDEDVPWVEFDVLFPSGQETEIQVSYSLQGTGYPPYTAFYYVLESGAGWKGTIGEAEIILRLPYSANEQNIVQNLEIGWATTTPGGSFEGNEVRWFFKDFEPGPEGVVQNMAFAMVAPWAWNAVLKETRNITQNPKDGEAWGRLAKAYKQIFLMNKGYREDPGGITLYEKSVQAYQKCLALLPGDAQWHAGYADLLLNYSYWQSWSKGPEETTIRGLDEILTALKLAPKDSVVLGIAEELLWLFPDGMTEVDGGYDFPWLTQTPTALSTATMVNPTALPPQPSQTPVVMAAATSMPTVPPASDPTEVSVTAAPAEEQPPARKGLPICSSIGLIPAAGVVFGLAARSRRKQDPD